MKPGIEHIATLERIKGPDGTDQFGGTMNLATLKKLKLQEFEIVMVPIQAMPPAIAGLLTKNATGQDGMLMFAVPSTAEPATRRKG